MEEIAMELVIFGILAFIFGTIFGSFVSVLVHRLVIGQTVIWGHSYCPACKHALHVQDLIPLVSYALTRGKCRYCKKKISWQYPAIELASGLLFVLAMVMSLHYSPPLPLELLFIPFIYLTVIFTLFLALFFIDFRYQLLLDVLVFPAFGMALLFKLFLATYADTGLQMVGFDLLSGIVLALCFLTLLLVTKGQGMGGGDVKFALVMGLVVGWPNIIVAVFFAFLSGAIVGVGLILLGRKKMKQTIAFGPFLILGTLVGMLFGGQIMHWFLYGNFI